MKIKTKQNPQLTIRSRLRIIIKWMRDKLIFLLLLPFGILIGIVILTFKVIVGIYTWTVTSVNKYYHPILTFLSPLNSFTGINSERAVEILLQIEKLIGHEFNKKHSESIIDYLTIESTSSMLFVIQSYTPFQIDENTKQKLVALLKEWEEEQSNFFKKEVSIPQHKIEVEMLAEDILERIEKTIGYKFNEQQSKSIIDCLTSESTSSIVSTIQSNTPFQIDEINKIKLVTLLKELEVEKLKIWKDLEDE